METQADEGLAHSRTALIDRISAALGDADRLDESRLRLGVAVALSLAGLYFFRMAAAQTLAASVAGALLVLLVLYVGLHRVGLRLFSRIWPGPSEALSTALLVACLCPPGLPPALVAGLGAAAVLAEGLQRRVLPPLALSGVLLAWGVAWLWWARTGLPLLAPGTLRSLGEPILLWTTYQIAVDPLRLYAGNVAGALGATSFGLAAIGVLVLGYTRRVSWLFLAGFYAPPLAALLVTRRPLTVYLLCAQALVLGGIVAAEVRRLPRAWPWRLAGGIVAGAISAALLLQGRGAVGYGIGVLAAATLLSGVQLAGVLGSRAPLPARRPQPPRAPGQAQAQLAGGLSPLRLAVMVLVLPVGLFLLWRDEYIPDSQRITLVALGSLLYVAAVAGSVTWLWLLRLPT